MSKNCIVLNSALLLITSLLFYLGAHVSRFSISDSLYSSTEFPGTESQWLVKGDSSHFKWSESNVQLYQKDISDKREAYILRAITLKNIDTGSTLSDLSNGNKSIKNHKKQPRLLRIRGEIDVSRATLSTTLDRSRQAGYMVWFFSSKGTVKKYITVKPFSAHKEAKYFADRTVIVPHYVDSIALVFMLRDSDAVFDIRSMSASLVQESVFFKYTSYLLWGCYCMFLCFSIWLIMGSKAIIATSGLVVLMAVLIFGVVMPEAIRFEYLQSLYKIILSDTRLIHSSLELNVMIFKAGHVLAFICLSLYLFVFRKNNNHSIGCLILGLCLFAISTEAIQLYRYDRETRVTDVLLNLLGVGIGYLIFIFYNCLLLHRRSGLCTENHSDTGDSR